MMLEALRREVAAQDDLPVAMLSDPIRTALPAEVVRRHTPPRLPPHVSQLRSPGGRQAVPGAALLFLFFQFNVSTGEAA